MPLVALAAIGISLTGGSSASAAPASPSPAGTAVANPVLEPDFPAPPTLPDDYLQLVHQGQDFGGGSLENNVPSDYGTLTWDLASATITPRLKGTLFMATSFGVNARMLMNYYDVHDNYLETTLGQAKSPATNEIDETARDRFRSSRGSTASPTRTNSRVIFVGKAKSLRSRLNSYFGDQGGLHLPHPDDGAERGQGRVDRRADRDRGAAASSPRSRGFDPRFNVKYRDDKSYPWLCVQHSARSSRG